MREITIEVTNYCPFRCKYCSSNAIDNIPDATFVELKHIYTCLEGWYDRIIISGGEPLFHPSIGRIIYYCKQHTNDVVVYTNMITHVAYNANVIDGITVDVNLTTLDNVNEIHVLKRVKQGREATRPEVKFSSNWDKHDCQNCGDFVLKPDGTTRPSPCNKE
jgi:molybdenum cofactor biosynthesis enzyme MoaA